MTKRLGWLLVLLGVFLVFDIAAITILLVDRNSSAVAILGKVTSSGTAAIGGPFTLQNTDGMTVTDQTFRGKWMMIYFGYTSCPDARPTALNNMSLALEKLGSESDKLQALFITIDPARDTREVMSSFLKSFDSRIVGLVGSQSQIDGIIRTYRIYVKLHTGEGENYLMDHSSYFYIMDPDGKFVDVIEGVTPGDRAANHISELFKQSST